MRNINSSLLNRHFILRETPMKILIVFQLLVKIVYVVCQVGFKVSVVPGIRNEMGARVGSLSFAGSVFEDISEHVVNCDHREAKSFGKPTGSLNSSQKWTRFHLHFIKGETPVKSLLEPTLVVVHLGAHRHGFLFVFVDYIRIMRNPLIYLINMRLIHPPPTPDQHHYRRLRVHFFPWNIRI